MDFVNGNRMRAFHAADAFALEAYRAFARTARSPTSGLAEAIRRTALRSGGALVAAAARCGAPAEQRLLERARDQLAEGRYYLYLARRLGLLDPKRYRGLTVRHDAATREIEALLRPSVESPSDRPP